MPPSKKTPVKKTAKKKAPPKKPTTKKATVKKATVKKVVTKPVVADVPPTVVADVPPTVVADVPPTVVATVLPTVVTVLPTVVTVPPTVVTNNESECSKLKDQLNEMLTYVNSLGDMSFNDLKKNLQRDLTRLTKSALTQCNKVEKENNKFTKKKTKREQTQGTGFEKKVLISPEFKNFILTYCNGTVGEDNLLSRKEGSNYIHTYIKGHNIQKPECKRHLQPDKALQSILGELTKDVNAKTGKKDSDVGYTYFNLQKYIKGCYLPSV